MAFVLRTQSISSPISFHVRRWPLAGYSLATATAPTFDEPFVRAVYRELLTHRDG